jgi:hypothetical protein
MHSELVLTTQANSVLPQLMKEDSTIDVASVHAHVCSREQPTNPVMLGAVDYGAAAKGVLEAEFNREHLSWHYGWLSSKGAHKAEHCFQVHILVPVIPAKLDAR